MKKIFKETKLNVSMIIELKGKCLTVSMDYPSQLLQTYGHEFTTEEEAKNEFIAQCKWAETQALKKAS